MMDKLNVAALEEYSQSYAKRLAAYFFIDHEVITGKEILQLSEIKQINLFAIGNLFDAWQQETNQFKSPYFDYEVAEVKNALKQFMDTVSRHIAVGKHAFEPLLAQAVQDTLLLLLNPLQYFHRLQDPNEPVFKLDRLKERVKYVHINKFLLTGLIERLESEGKSVLASEKGMQWLETTALTQASNLDSFEKYQDSFSDKLPLDKDAFFYSSEEDAPQYELPIESTVPIVAEGQEPMQRLAEKEVEQLTRTEQSNERSLHERLAREQPTLNDSLKQTTQESLLDRHLKTRIENIRSAIPLNQKFVFINELFRGDNSAYHQALNELEQCTDFESAAQLLKDNYAKSYGWTMEGEAEEAFLEIIERKFY